MYVTPIDRSNGSPEQATRIGKRSIADIQRRRMIEAVAAVALGVGVRNLTVAHIVAQARVSRRTFYEIFDGCEDCVLAAFEDGAAQMEARVADAARSEARWQERIRTALAVLLQFMDENPHMARLMVLEAPAAGEAVMRRRQEANAKLVALVDEARAENQTAAAAPLLAAEGAVGAVAAVLQSHMIDHPGQPLSGLLNPLTSMIVLPYLGTTAARRELARPAPSMPASAKRVTGDPFGDLDMRLTYRTVRVLAAVAANPGSSNRAVGESAGVSDQGQASKLLRRLQRLDLVENVPKGPLRGEPNSWTLTAKGWEVHAAVRAERGAA